MGMKNFNRYDFHKDSEENKKEMVEDFEIEVEMLDSLINQDIYQVFIFARKNKERVELFPIYLKIDQKLQNWPYVKPYWKRFCYIEPGKYNVKQLANLICSALKEMGE